MIYQTLKTPNKQKLQYVNGSSGLFNNKNNKVINTNTNFVKDKISSSVYIEFINRPGFVTDIIPIFSSGLNHAKVTLFLF